MAFIGNTSTTQAFTPAVDFFSGNGSTTSFTLSRPVASVAQVQAVIANVPQNPSTAFTVNGNTVTFTSAPPTGTNNIYVYYTSPITQVIAPSQGTVQPSSLSTGGPTWNTNGNVGIGTSSPSQKLDVNGVGRMRFASGTGAGYWLDTTGNASRFFVGTDAVTESWRIYDSIGGANRVFLDSSGNVGIGTSSPSSYSSKTWITGTGGTSNNPFGFDDGASGLALRFNLVNNTGPRQINFQVNPDGSGFTTKMTLDSSGNLLVGTTSSYNGGVTSAIGSYRFTSYAPDIYAACIQHIAGSTQTFVVYGNGNVANTNNSYGAISDRKLKENIVDATPKLDKLMQVRIRNYNLIGDYGQIKQIGVIADELEPIFPSLVEETADTDAKGNDLGTTTKSVKYSVFVPMLIKAMQEQQAIITDLKARIETLEAK